MAKIDFKCEDCKHKFRIYIRGWSVKIPKYGDPRRSCPECGSEKTKRAVLRVNWTKILIELGCPLIILIIVMLAVLF